MKLRASCCCCAEGFVGYAPAMVWRSVQDELPSWSTSGGQFSGGKSADVAPAGGVVVDILEGVVVFCFVIAAQEAKEVQLRHLWSAS